MRSTRLHIFILLFITSTVLTAQMNEENHFNTWWSLKVKTDLSDRFYINSQISLRRYDFLESWQKIILRARGHYKINDFIVAGLGYTYSRNFAANQPDRYISVPRSDIFTEFGFTNKFDDLKLVNRFRLEHRFTGIMTIPEDVTEDAFIEGTKFSNRLRYRMTFKHPIKKEEGKTKMYAAGFYELFLRMNSKFQTQNISGNVFKIVAGYNITEITTIEIGYRRQVKHKSDYSLTEKNSIADIALKYRFDFSHLVDDKLFHFFSDSTE